MSQPKATTVTAAPAVTANTVLNSCSVHRCSFKVLERYDSDCTASALHTTRGDNTPPPSCHTHPKPPQPAESCSCRPLAALQLQCEALEESLAVCQRCGHLAAVLTASSMLPSTAAPASHGLCINQLQFSRWDALLATCRTGSSKQHPPVIQRQSHSIPGTMLVGIP